MPAAESPASAIAVLFWPDLGPGARSCIAGLSDAIQPAAEPETEAQARQLMQTTRFDLVVLGSSRIADPGLLASMAEEPAAVIWADTELSLSTLRLAFESGAQDVLLPGDQLEASVLRRLMAAVWRQRRVVHARTAYATDLATGLPHRQQLIEHMAHLLALRDREPAPMALLVLRVEGLETVAAQRGAQAAASLRRKLAVRLRAGLRASDVVAAIAGDRYAVLLAWIDAPSDVDGVGAKLVSAVQRPFSIGGVPLALAVSLGLARYPEDGKDAEGLLEAANAGASAQQGQGRSGFVNLLENGPVDAANDDSA
jgi:diguanylate cyclase (GGDEF)-like protein